MADQSDRLSGPRRVVAGTERQQTARPLLAMVAAADADERRYTAAVAFGANMTGTSAASEAGETAIVLLTTAGHFVPAITRAAYALDVLLGAGPEQVDARLVTAQGRDLRRAASGALRLTHRALEVHARNMGYAPAVYHSRALLITEVALQEARDRDLSRPPALNQTIDDAQEGVSLALQALEVNRGAVPGHLASALGSWFALYLVGSAIAR